MTVPVVDVLVAVVCVPLCFYVWRIGRKLSWRAAEVYAIVYAVWACTPLMLDMVWQVPSWCRLLAGGVAVVGAVWFGGMSRRFRRRMSGQGARTRTEQTR